MRTYVRAWVRAYVWVGVHMRARACMCVGECALPVCVYVYMCERQIPRTHTCYPVFASACGHTNGLNGQQDVDGGGDGVACVCVGPTYAHTYIHTHAENTVHTIYTNNRAPTHNCIRGHQYRTQVPQRRVPRRGHMEHSLTPQTHTHTHASARMHPPLLIAPTDSIQYMAREINAQKYTWITHRPSFCCTHKHMHTYIHIHTLTWSTLSTAL